MALGSNSRRRAVSGSATRRRAVARDEPSTTGTRTRRRTRRRSREEAEEPRSKRGRLRRDREEGRGRGRAGQRRGRGNYPETKESPLLGIISIGCFALYWLLIFLLVGMVVDAAESGRMTSGDAGRMVTGAIFALLSLVVGLILGAVGIFVKTSNTVIAAIGASLNGIMLLIGLLR